MNYQGVIVRRTCRACGSFRLSLVHDFGEIFASDFVSSSRIRGEECAIVLVSCDECSLVQLRHTFPQDSLYKHYWYRSGTNPTIVADLKNIVETAMTMVKLEEGDVWLDIGANDGTLLTFVPSNVIKVGCEPAQNLQEDLKQNADIVLEDFWNARKYEMLSMQKGKK